MGKKKPRGICRICGEYRKLSFEHVPPGATYNKQAVQLVSVRDYLEAEKRKDAMPWELGKVKGKISQRGRGDYYICGKCNNDTGSWYGVHYKKFVNVLMYVMHQGAGKDYKNVTLEVREMRPLPIIKQVMTMFCDINGNLTENDPALRSFIMDKANQGLDTNKYRIFMYLLKGGIEKTAPLSALIHLGESEPVMVSEIAAIPVGFVLYVDLPADYTPQGTEITNFVHCGYDDIATITLALNIFENNTWLPTDFRSKEEIKATIEKSRKWEEEHGIRT